MSNFNEAEHPRDEQGRFTLKGSVSAVKEAEEKEKMQKRADILYPSMKDVKTQSPPVIGLGEYKTYNVEDIMYPSMNKQKNTKDLIEEIGFDKNKYEIKGNTISPKQKDYVVIDGIKYPKQTNNKTVLKMQNDILSERKEKYKAQREKYLNTNKGKGYQYGIDNIDNDKLRKVSSLVNWKETAENLNMSKANHYMDTDYAKQHKIYNNYKELPVEFKDYFKDKISQQIGADKLETTKGIFIDKNSESSKSLAKKLINEDDFKYKLKEYEKALKHNFSVNDSISFKGRNNWHYALGNADIRNMHINKKGDIELYITDTYDFNDGENGPVAVGKDRQDKGNIKPYFSIYHVVIPKEEYREYLLK